MTKKEAIKYLKDVKEEFAYFPLHCAALEMAIKALKQIEAIENIINVSNLTIQEDVLKYKMIVDVVKGEW